MVVYRMVEGVYRVLYTGKNIGYKRGMGRV